MIVDKKFFFRILAIRFRLYITDRYRSLWLKCVYRQTCHTADGNRTMKNFRWTLAISLAAVSLFFTTTASDAFSVAEKAQKRRIEIIHYLRFMKPMIMNFPCEPFPDCYIKLKKEKKLKEAPRAAAFAEVKRVYQEGMIYFYEGQYLKAYNRFLDSQSRTEAILEGLSQHYINRTEVMLREAIEKKTEADPTDMTVVDVSIEYGPDSKKRRDFSDLRESPNTSRRYDPKEVHWAQNKWYIEQNVKKGYERLGLARKARGLALQVDKNFKKEQKITPTERQKRIEFYLAAIKLCRQAKRNAAYIYQLKYPYDNYAIFNQFGTTEAGRFEAETTPKIENVSMNWSKNPYVLPKRLHPVFDLRLPAKYRRDASDSRNMVYEEEVDILIRMRYYDKEKRDKIEGLNFKDEGGSANTTP